LTFDRNDTIAPLRYRAANKSQLARRSGAMSESGRKRGDEESAKKVVYGV
jgi:hypothetical protein